MLEWIRSQLDSKDGSVAQLVESGFDSKKLCKEFYIGAFSSRSRFVREFFGADLRLRNAKVRYLNEALERPLDKDILEVEEAPYGDDDKKFSAIFAPYKNLLERERMMDDFLWEKADEITRMSSFCLDNVLALIAKLCIINRWLTLDQETGKQMLRHLVGELRSSCGQIEFKTN